MKWCPKCESEYEAYIETCSDCGETLISEEAYHQKRKDLDSDIRNYNPAPLDLVVVYESTLDSEVLIVTSLLEEHGIYSEVKNTGIGSYLQIYSGTNFLGTSVCVKEKDSEEATSLIKNLWGESSIQHEEEAFEPLEEQLDDPELRAYSQNREKSLGWMRNFLKVFILLSFGTALIINLIGIFSNI